MKSHSFDSAGVLAGVRVVVGKDKEGADNGTAWTFADQVQAKLHAPMFAADLDAEQRAKLEAVKLPQLEPAADAKG